MICLACMCQKTCLMCGLNVNWKVSINQSFWPWIFMYDLFLVLFRFQNTTSIIICIFWHPMLELLPLKKNILFFFSNLRLVKKHIPVSTAWAKVPWKTRRSFQTKDQQFRWWVYQRTFCQLSRLRCPFWIWQWGRDGQVGTTRKKIKIIHKFHDFTRF